MRPLGWTRLLSALLGEANCPSPTSSPTLSLLHSTRRTRPSRAPTPLPATSQEHADRHHVVHSARSGRGRACNRCVRPPVERSLHPTLPLSPRPLSNPHAQPRSFRPSSVHRAPLWPGHAPPSRRAPATSGSTVRPEVDRSPLLLPLSSLTFPLSPPLLPPRPLQSSATRRTLPSGGPSRSSRRRGPA
jgi:hypothetical protein